MKKLSTISHDVWLLGICPSLQAMWYSGPLMDCFFPTHSTNTRPTALYMVSSDAPYDPWLLPLFCLLLVWEMVGRDTCPGVHSPLAWSVSCRCRLFYKSPSTICCRGRCSLPPYSQHQQDVCPRYDFLLLFPSWMEQIGRWQQPYY